MSDKKRTIDILQIKNKEPKKIKKDVPIVVEPVLEQPKSQEMENEDEPLDSTPTFDQLGVKPWMVTQLHKLGMKIPTIIQEKCIPETFAGKDIIGMSQTGTGKTASFALPIIQNLAKDMFGIYALVITPTRELAHQIKKHFEILAGDIPLRVALIVGGLDYLAQGDVLQSRPHVIIGTPGRIEACMRLNDNHDYFKKIKYLVFDEADRILSMEFSLDIETILKHCNPNRQTLLYSATLNDKVKKLAAKALKDESKVFLFDACNLYKTADNLEQYYLFMPKTVKDCYLYQLIRTTLTKKSSICMVFFSSIQECEIITKILQQMGIKADSLHAAKSQKDRIQALNEFRKRKIKVLLTTDVGNRGLDIPAVSMVINYDLPDTTEKYVHRVGRTARAGQFGVAVSLISQYEVKRIKAIEGDIQIKMAKYPNFSEKEAETFLYPIAQKRCYAKIKLIEDGFAESYQVRREYKKESQELLTETTIEYEKKLLAKLTNKI